MDTVSVVLVGAFNPAIFQPMWFAAQELLSREDAENAKINVVHNDLTQFETRQFRISVEQNRFIAGCEAIHRNIVRDLVISCFGRVLIHCPIALMGINRELHFNCGNEKKRSEFGLAIAPLAPWGKWGAEIEKPFLEGKAQHGGMIAIQMRQTPRPDERRGYIQTEIQPSPLIKHEAGIFIRVNSHLEFSHSDEHPALLAVETLDDVWEESMAKHEEIISEVMQLASGKNTNV